MGVSVVRMSYSVVMGSAASIDHLVGGVAHLL